MRQMVAYVQPIDAYSYRSGVLRESTLHAIRLPTCHVAPELLAFVQFPQQRFRPVPH